MLTNENSGTLDRRILAHLLAGTLACAGGGLAALGNSVEPAEGASLRHKHVLFTFDPIDGETRYQLQVVLDDGSEFPFLNVPVADVEITRPRRIVKSELEFGEAYAWRVRAAPADQSPGPWNPVHRFSLFPFPEELIDLVSVNDSFPDLYQPGLTLSVFNAIPGAPGTAKYGLAVDQTGDIVWFYFRNIEDLRQLPNGNLMFVHEARKEARLSGSVVWTSHLSDANYHEAFNMPNGNVLLMIYEYQNVERDGQDQQWRGCVLTEITRDGQTVWTWNPFEHLSILDFDECLMQFPHPSGYYDWLHSNAVVYDATDDSVYFSPRNLSRIIKIDHATGDIIWNLGFDMPSGDVDFGDDLFSLQHAPEILPNGNVLIYDNGRRRGHSYCDPPSPYSAAIELSVDPNAPVPVSVEWIYEQDFFTHHFGDADRLPNGNTLITAGSNGRILEVASDGTVVWELTATSPAAMYRADRIASLFPLRGDADGDDDLDLLDFGSFQCAYGGMDNFAIYRTRLVHDFDEDGDVDHVDFASHHASLTGHGP